MSVIGDWLKKNAHGDEPARLLDLLNHEIAHDEISIGPSYFMTDPENGPDLGRIWERAIMPLLEEYYYGTTWDADKFSLAKLKIRLAGDPTEPRAAEGEEPAEDGRVTPITMDAWSSKDDVDLSHDQAAELSKLKLVDVMSRPTRSGWTLVANSRVGVAMGNGWELRVSPESPRRSSSFFSRMPPIPRAGRTSPRSLRSIPELMDAVASGFSLHALRALDRGVLRGYLHLDERLATLRGRIRFGDQIARGVSLPLPSRSRTTTSPRTS